MQNYTTIVCIIELRQRRCSYEVIQKRYSIESNTLQLIMKRYGEIDIPLHDLKGMEPSKDVPICLWNAYLVRNSILIRSVTIHNSG